MINKYSVSETVFKKESTEKAASIAIMLMNDLFLDDFDSILPLLEFKDRLLIITNTEISDRDYGVKFMFDNLDNVETLLEKLRRYKSIHNVHFCGIVGNDEEYGYLFSESIAREFKLEFNSKEALDTVSDKYLQMCALKSGGVEVPAFRLVDNYNESENFSLPCVIKPVRGISSLYVYKCSTERELEGVFTKLDKYKSNPVMLSLTHSPDYDSKTYVHRSAEIGKHFIQEEYIGGNEYSCDFLAGREVTLLRVVRKIESKEHFPFFEALYLFNPDAPVSEFTSSCLREVCKKIAESIGIQTGLCMADFRFDPKKKKIVVIETTTRPGFDDFIGLMHRNYGYISLSIALRQIFRTIDKDSLREIPKGNSIFIYLFAPGSGTLKKFDVSRLEKLRLKGVREIAKYYNAGDKVEYLSLLKTPPFIGHVIIDDISAEDIDGAISQIRSCIDIELE